MPFAMIFPGQGSQSVGMMNALAEHHDVVAQTFREASEALKYDLWDVVSNGPGEKLDKTQVTQPAMLAAGVATWRCWQALDGAKPTALAGHSLGEYTALVCAGALELPDAIRLVDMRGKFMQSAVPQGEGAMAAIIGLDDADIEALCSDAADGDVLEAVNFNAPGQVVIAGQTAAVDRGCALAKERGARRALKIAVSVPAHTSLMKSAAERLAQHLHETPMKKPTIPVLHNVDAQPRHDADELRRALETQLFSPVRWVDSIVALRNRQLSQFVECGPGKVLTGLLKRIDREATGYTTDTADSLVAATEAVEGSSK